MPRSLVLLIRATVAVLTIALVVTVGRGLIQHTQAMLVRVRAAALLPPVSPALVHGRSLDDDLVQAVQRSWPASWGLAKPLDHGPCEAGDRVMSCVNMLGVNGWMVQIRSADGVRWRGAACFPLSQASTAIALQRRADAQEPPVRPNGLPEGIAVQRLLRAPGHTPAPDRNLLVLNGIPMTLMRRGDRPADDCLAVEVPEPLIPAMLLAEAGLPLPPTPEDQGKALNRLSHASVDGWSYRMPSLPSPPLPPSTSQAKQGSGKASNDEVVVMRPSPGPRSTIARTPG